jgi:RimJ/RimL family protein N-acetyltransferase
MNYWEGKLIRLRAIEPEDAEFFYRWNLDVDTQRWLDRVWLPTSLESQREWAQRFSRQRPEDDTFFWVIESQSEGVVGSIDTHHCDRRVGSFQYGVGVRKEFRGHGYATEAILLVLRYYFEELRYQKVTVGVHAGNDSSICLHKKLGFTLEGRLRRMVYTAGELSDALMYGMTAEEFAEKLS